MDSNITELHNQTEAAWQEYCRVKDDLTPAIDAARSRWAASNRELTKAKIREELAAEIAKEQV